MWEHGRMRQGNVCEGKQKDYRVNAPVSKSLLKSARKKVKFLFGGVCFVLFTICTCLTQNTLQATHTLAWWEIFSKSDESRTITYASIWDWDKEIFLKRDSLHPPSGTPSHWTAETGFRDGIQVWHRKEEVQRESKVMREEAEDSTVAWEKRKAGRSHGTKK